MSRPRVQNQFTLFLGDGLTFCFAAFWHRYVAENISEQQVVFNRTPDSRTPREYTNEGMPRLVSPYALCWSNGSLYLYAFDGAKFVYFRVDRMEAISKPLPLPREGEDKYSERDITARKTKVFNMYPGPECEVIICFLNKVADVVIDEFGEVNMMYQDASHFAIRASIALSPNFYAWIASLGEQAQILEPPVAVEGMKAFLKNASSMYGDEEKE